MSVLETGSLFVDANSFARNTTSAVSAIRPLPVAAGLFVAASQAAAVVGVPIGCAIAWNGYKKAKTALQDRDWESAAHNTAWGTIGVSYAGLSGLLAADGAMTLAGKAAPSMIGTAFGWGGVGFYGALLGYSSYGLYQSAKFRKELRQAKSEGRALEWIKTQVATRKAGALQLRVGAQAAALLAQELPENEADAQELILEVEKGSFKESVKHITLIVLAILGIAASLCVLFLAGPFSPLLFAVGAVIWIAIDSSSLHNYLGETFWKLSLPVDSASEKKEEHSAA